MTTSLVRIGHCQNGSQGRMGDEFPLREGICKTWGGKAEPPSTPATQPGPVIGPMISIHFPWTLLGRSSRVSGRQNPYFTATQAHLESMPCRKIDTYNHQRYGRAHLAPTFRSWATHRPLQVLQAASGGRSLTQRYSSSAPSSRKTGAKMFTSMGVDVITTSLSGLPLGTLPTRT